MSPSPTLSDWTGFPSLTRPVLRACQLGLQPNEIISGEVQSRSPTMLSPLWRSFQPVPSPAFEGRPGQICWFQDQRPLPRRGQGGLSVSLRVEAPTCVPFTGLGHPAVVCLLG